MGHHKTKFFKSKFPPLQRFRNDDLRTKIKKTLSDDQKGNEDSQIVDFRVPKIKPEWETDEEVLNRLKFVFK